MIGRPTITRPAPLPAGVVFWFWGRPLKVVRAAGTDPAAPVIVEELQDSEFALAGQLALWSLDGVRRQLARQPEAMMTTRATPFVHEKMVLISTPGSKQHEWDAGGNDTGRRRAQRNRTWWR